MSGWVDEWIAFPINPFIQQSNNPNCPLTAWNFMNERQTVLLVDDSVNDLVLLRIAFKKAKINTSLQEVHNGEEAIAYLKGEGSYSDRTKYPLPAVMLLDLNMPMKNGFDVLTWLRAQPRLKRLIVVILTASIREEDVERAFDLGANSYLVKPSAMEDLTCMLQCLRDWFGYNHFPPLNDAMKNMRPMPARQVFLYAEDTENDVLLMRSAIAKAGLTIDLKTVQDGEEVIRYLNGEGPYSDRRNYPLPTVMLLDLKLPKKNGFQILEWLRLQPHLRRMIVIVLTASRRQEEVDLSYELGANAVLVKPTTIDELVSIVAQISTWLELTRQPQIHQLRRSAS